MADLNKAKAIEKYIFQNYKLTQPIFLTDFYSEFPDINQITIRSIIRRLIENERIIKISNGVFARTKSTSSLSKTEVRMKSVIEQKYLSNDEGQVIGYLSGINLANKLGLTTQTASVDLIISNNVSAKKREIMLKNNRYIVNSPRIAVNERNYKLMQVLDILTDFEKYSEYQLKYAAPKLLNYLKSSKINETELDDIVSAYPLVTQVKFYKMGGLNVLAQEQK